MFGYYVMSALVLSFLMTRYLVLFAPRLGLIDVPNDRSGHDVPTPRGGGLAFVTVFSFGLFGLFFSNIITADLYFRFLVTSLLIAGVGLVDDFGHLSPLLRLFIHSIVVIGFLYTLKYLPALDLGLTVWRWHAFGALVLYLGFVWLINLYNFMDGIDGLAAAEAIFVSLAAALLIYLTGSSSPLIALLLLLAACVAGFLIFNYPPARIFMGDVGSGFLGCTLGAILVMSLYEHVLTPWQWLILLAVFWVDATMTLFSRARAGASVFEAHRTFVFHMLSDAAGSHKKVLHGIMLLNITWLFPMAVISMYYSNAVLFIAVLAVLPVFVFWIYFRKKFIDVALAV